MSLMPNEKELLDILLSNRGIKKEYRDKFLNPSYEDGLYDPFLMKDMEIASVRIFEAIEAKEKIVIYSDYDCDGIPAAVIMHDFFEKINYPFSIYPHTKENEVYQNAQGASFSYGVGVYIPDRHDEGYGLHLDAIDHFIEDEVNLLITFDLGITAVEEVARATASGIDVIITDHHLPQDNIPKAYAILNPKQDGCNYPDKMLCGAGIAFKLIQALIKKYGEYWNIHEGWEKWLLDMASVATLADQVPLLDENRVLAYYGLKVLQKGRRPGLVEIFSKSGVKISKLNEEDITFTLAPRINAASRMADPMNAFETLATKDNIEAVALAKHLMKINDERKVMVAQIMKDIKKTLGKRLSGEDDKPVIVVGNPNWRIGVLGIVASKVVEEYKKSAFIWGGDGNGFIRGSCRSFGSVNLVKLMGSLPENSLVEFGGHVKAGGFSVSHEEIHFFEDRLVKVFNESIDEGLTEEDEIKIDAVIDIDDINEENYRVIEKLAPYGMGNPKPLFLIERIPIVGIKEFGKDKNHLELTFENSHGRKVKAIAFFKTRESFNVHILNIGERINLTASFEKSTFNNKTELRLRIVDVVI